MHTFALEDRAAVWRFWLSWQQHVTHTGRLAFICGRNRCLLVEQQALLLRQVAPSGSHLHSLHRHANMQLAVQLHSSTHTGQELSLRHYNIPCVVLLALKRLPNGLQHMRQRVGIPPATCTQHHRCQAAQHSTTRQQPATVRRLCTGRSYQLVLPCPKMVCVTAGLV
jgi:hypothetical protein